MGAGKISVLVPVYRDGACLDKLLEQLSEAACGRSLSSPTLLLERTLEVLEKYGKRLSV